MAEKVAKLPPLGSDRPLGTQTATFDSWPAHSSGQTYGQMMLVKKQVGEGRAELTNPWDKKVIPKPKFLEQLETYLQKELRALDCPSKGPSELRLQAHREVFEYLISDFKTYRPLLAAIKNEYELVISDLHQRVRELEPLKQMLVTVSERCDQKVMQIQENQRQDLVDLRKENIRLLQRIDTMKEQEKDYIAQIDKMREELGAEYEKYKNECDQRRMLLQDLNEMRYQREQEQSVTASQAEGGTEEEVGAAASEEKELDDPVILKIALRKTREANQDLTWKLNEMDADYANVIPRRQFELLQTEYNNYKESMKAKEEENEKFTNELEALTKSYAQVVEQRDEFYTELESLKRASTPRPRWDKCGDYITGGVKRWKELTSENPRSDHLVDVLLAEITGADVSTFKQQDTFEGLGIGEDVPVYLRFEGEVKNCMLDRANTARLIKDFWKHKVAADSKVSLGSHQPMGDFLAKYLSEKYGTNKSIEWAYNLVDACRRLSFDLRIRQFHLILTGEMDEQVYHKLARVTAMMKRDLEKAADGDTVVSLDQLKASISKHLPKKTDFMIHQLVECAIRVTDSANDPTRIPLAPLFEDGEDSKVPEFVELLCSQDTQERQELAESVENALGEAAATDTEITGKELKDAMLAADSTAGKETLDYVICWCWSVQKPENATYPKTVKDVIAKLQNSAIPLL